MDGQVVSKLTVCDTPRWALFLPWKDHLILTWFFRRNLILSCWKKFLFFYLGLYTCFVDGCWWQMSETDVNSIKLYGWLFVLNWVLKFLKCHHPSIPSLSIDGNHYDVTNIIVADVTNIILAEIFSCSVYLFKLFSMLDIISKMTKNVLDASSPIMASFGMISMSSF